MPEDKYNTLHYVIAELKQYGIKHIVASPGTQNSTFNMLVQEDSDFKCYSVVDERSASYVALGIARETDEPAVITCTGATAARNFMSGMTEAFYQEVPVVALTFYNYGIHKFGIFPQYTDRSVSQNDIKSMSVHLPEVRCEADKKFVLQALNAALSRAKYNREPVHINVPAAFDYNITNLPNDCWHTEYHYDNWGELRKYLKDKKVGIYIGTHRRFTKEEQDALSDFATSVGAVVFCDNTSNYYGNNKVMIMPYICLKNPEVVPDIIIDWGAGISSHHVDWLVLKDAEYWCVVENYKYKARYNKSLKHLLIGKEKNIAKALKLDSDNVPGGGNNTFYACVKAEIDSLKYNDIPLSTLYVAQEFSKYIPDNSILHLSIMIPVNKMGYFDLPKGVHVTSNTGGFGIDGPLSALVGQSLVAENKKAFCFTGDLAFFYDMNILGNRHINKNLRILLLNNNKGNTMHTNPWLEKHRGDKLDTLVCAAGHYSNGARGWVESCGFKYLCANNKDEFNAQIKDFCDKDYGAPVVFEVITTTKDELTANTTICRGAINPPREKISLLEKIFSIRNERRNSIKHKVVRMMGVKLKFKVKDKNEKN